MGKSPQIDPPILVRELPLTEILKTPLKGIPKPVFPPVPPTPVTKLQQDTPERFLSLETTFDTRMEALMVLVKSMAQGAPTAPQPAVSHHVVGGEEVDVMVEEGEIEEGTSEPSSIKPKQVVAYLEGCEQAIPQSKTSKALAVARRATASAPSLPTARGAR